MKLKDLLSELNNISQEIGSSIPFICGGTPRDKFMKRLDNISDIDITTGDKTVDFLSQEFAAKLQKTYNITRRTMSDGHSSLFIGNVKIDFSSNFNVPNIDQLLLSKGIKKPTDMQREMYSRDFTCNSLLLTVDLKTFIDPLESAITDIKNKKIKTCLAPNITLASNKNRVIRAIYLACKLDFDIDDSIISFVQKNPQSVKISTERVLKEKLNQAFQQDADKAKFLIKKMGLSNYLPIDGTK